MKQLFGYVDMNAYFASVEQQTNPALRGKPIVVAGRPSHPSTTTSLRQSGAVPLRRSLERSVVTTASYEARALGIRTAMSTREAVARLPSLTIVPPDYGKYQAYTQRIVELAATVSPVVSLCSIDELSLNLGHLLVPGDPDQTMQQLRQCLVSFKAALVATVGPFVTASIGVASSATLAKIAADHRKPDGHFVLTDSAAWARRALIHGLEASSWRAFRQHQPLEVVPGIGNKLAATLRLKGYRTLDDLADADPGQLGLQFGVLGLWLSQVSRGLPTSRSTSSFQHQAVERSMSHTTTLPQDLPLRLTRTTFFVLAERVAERLRRAGLVAHQLTVGFGRTNAPSWYANERSAYPIRTGLELFRRGWHRVETEWGSRAPFIRRPHIGVTSLTAASVYPASLFPADRRTDRLALAVGSLRDRWGSDVVQAGTLFTTTVDRVPDGRQVRYDRLAAQ
jgi:DNA polymerase-4